MQKKEQNPHLIIKAVGVQPAYINYLHALADSPEMQSTDEAEIVFTTGHGEGSNILNSRVQFVRVLEAKLDPEYGTYTVTLKIPVATAVAFSGPTETVHTPITVLKRLGEILGFAAEEKFPEIPKSI